MLPSFLKPSYQQYKDDTDRFVAWLVNTAEKKCGLQPQMKAADKGHKYVATVKQLLKFGKAVAQSTNIHVPLSILARAQRAIELRKDVTAYHVGKRGYDRGHGHFNMVLEELCTILEPKTWKTPGEKKDEETGDLAKRPVAASVADEDEEAAAVPVTLMNRFAALDVEDLQDTPDKDFIAVEVVDRDEKSKADEGLTEAWFKLQCLFNDLHKWRSFLSQTWTEYRDQKIDLMTASVVTDSALQLARELVQEATQGWPKDLSEEHVPMGLQDLAYKIACTQRGLEPMPIEEAIASNEELAQVIEWFFLPQVGLLRGLVGIIDRDTMPVYKKGFFGTYDANADRANMSFEERANEDKVLIVELIPEFFTLASFKVDLPVTDDITNGFVEFWRTKKPSLWLSFATQILLDILHVMRTSRMDAWDDLRMCAKRNANIIDDFFKLSATHPKPKFWPEQANQELRNMRALITGFIENDAVALLRLGALKTAGLGKHADLDIADHFVFRRNPVLCGLSMMHINMRMQRMGQLLTNQWWDIQQLAFLYNLVQQSPGPSLAWPDMELFVKIHGEKLVFVGERPRDAAQSLNRLELATGISTPARFARDSRQPNLDFHRPDTNGRNARMLEPTNKVGNLFHARYAQGDKTWSLCSANVETFLNELSKELMELSAEEKKKPGRGGKTKSRRARVGRKWATTHEIGPLQLLAVLKTKLCQEEPILVFNYFGMHGRCIELLRLIRRKEDHKFQQYFTPAYMPDESLISNLVILVHHVARGSAMVGQQLGITGGGVKGTSRIVLSCGDVMRDYLGAKGSAACRELEVFCRNKGHVKVLVSGGQDEEDEDEDGGFFFNLEEVLGPAAMASLMTGVPMA